MVDRRVNGDTKGISTFAVVTAFLTLTGFIFFFWLLQGLLMPVLVGLLLAYVFGPVVTWLGKHWKWPPWLSVTVILLAIFGLLAGFAVWLLPVAVSQISSFFASLPDYIEELGQFVTEEFSLGEDARRRIQEFADSPEKLLPYLVKGTVQSFNIIAGLLGTTMYITIYVLLMLIFFITFSVHLSDFANWFAQFLPHSKKAEVTDALRKINEAAYAFLRTRILVALILGAVLGIGWWIADVPYWFLLGVVSAFLSLIPYAAGFAWVAAMILNALEAQDGILLALVWPTVVYIVAQQLEGWILTPYLQGEKLNVHPVVVLFAVLAGGSLAGLLGMLLAIPMTAAAQIIFTDHLKPRLIIWARRH